jgi:hypothetical protein
MPAGDKGNEMSEENPLYGLILFSAPGVLLYQAYLWLKTGIWTPLPISIVFDYFAWPHRIKGWIGLQSIIDWILDCPFSLLVFFLSFVAVILAVFIEIAVRAMLDREKKSA